MYVGVYILESVGEYMSGYKVTIGGNTWNFKNKDEVIHQLAYYLSESDDDHIRVEYPDKYIIEHNWRGDEE
jgi:hypothetical protein|tara:strand:+ start:563 stop:775 length:213 start_codon:yes stop_codon:yes gene_type:complete